MGLNKIEFTLLRFLLMAAQVKRLNITGQVPGIWLRFDFRFRKNSSFRRNFSVLLHSASFNGFGPGRVPENLGFGSRRVILQVFRQLGDPEEVQGFRHVLDDDGLVEGRVVRRPVLDDLGQRGLACKPSMKVKIP